jgi:hypothetical protein
MNAISHSIQLYAAKNRFARPVRTTSSIIFGTGFRRKSKTRILIFYSKNPISWSLVYPYFYYRKDLWEGLGASLAIRPVENFLDGSSDNVAADVVIVQPWFTVDAENLSSAFARYKSKHPSAKMVFQDSYAPTDIRLSKSVNNYIDVYQKKSIFRDRSQFQRSFLGDTNLSEYYGNLYGIPQDPVDWEVPDSVIEKLSLAPNFLTAPYLLKGFLGKAPAFDDRPIDLHSRIATEGTPWYTAMRRASSNAARSISGIIITPDDRIPQAKFISEMRRSKMCWSPFGYGELCWRDLEAFMTGAVLVKPSMDHVNTTPDLYREGETYLPVKWDFSDLDEVVRWALCNPEHMKEIAINAFHIAKKYLQDGSFVAETMSMMAMTGKQPAQR